MSDREDIQNLKEAVEAIKNGLSILWELHEADKAEMEETLRRNMARVEARFDEIDLVQQNLIGELRQINRNIEDLRNG